MTARSAVGLLLAGLSTAFVAVDAVDAAQRTFVSTGGLDSTPAGVHAGISAFAGQEGVTVAAPAGNVSLRGLAINGQGCNVGIGVQTGDVHIENCVISNIGGVGAAGNPKRLAQVESLRRELSAVKQALAAMAASRTAVVIAVL